MSEENRAEIALRHEKALERAGSDALTNPMAPQNFEYATRVAQMLATSQMVPEHMRNVPNIMLGMELAGRMGENLMTVLQSMYLVKGKPGWSASYVIAQAKKSKAFKGGIDWDVKGKGEGLEVTAFATLADTDKRVEFTVTMKMAKDDGWTSNKKYQTLPELMLRYRSAVLLCRLYAPEIMLGLHTEDENDVAEPVEVTVKNEPRSGRGAIGLDIEREAKEEEIVDAEVVEPEEEPEPVKTAEPVETPEEDLFSGGGDDLFGDDPL